MVKMDTEHDLSMSSMKIVNRKRKKDDDDTEYQSNNDEQVKIYICGSVIPTGEIRQLVEWHVFDRSRNREEAVVVAGVGEDGVIDSPLYSEEQNLSSKPNMYLNGFGCAVVNDDIYIIGGDNHDFKGSFGRYNYSSRRRFDEETLFPLSNKVRIFNAVSKNWRDFNHLMIRGRRNPVVVYVANKLFVFGSFCCILGPLVYPEPWAEYYDFGECGWLPLENIPKEFDKSLMAIGHAIISHTNHLLLWSFHSFALFNANDNTWLASLQNQTLERGVFSPHVAIVATNCGSILYWFYGHGLFAYDLMENKNIPSSDLGGDGAPLFTFQNPWDGPAFVASCDIVTAPHLISTGNKELCLIWFDILSQCICCTEFLLQEEKHKITWSGTHHYHHLSRGNQEGFSEITHCIPVVTPKSKMHQSSNKGDTKPQRLDPEFGDRDLRVVHSKLPMKNIDDDNECLLKTFADAVCDHISKCLKEDSEKERSEKRRVKRNGCLRRKEESTKRTFRMSRWMNFCRPPPTPVAITECLKEEKHKAKPLGLKREDQFRRCLVLSSFSTSVVCPRVVGISTVCSNRGGCWNLCVSVSSQHLHQP